MKKNRQSDIKNNIKKDKKKSPFGPSTKKELHNQAAGGVRSEYGPTERSTAAQIRASGQRQKDIGGWYGQLGDQQNQAATATDASYAAANAAMQANLNAAAQASQTQQGQIAGQSADFAKLTGADPSAFAPGVQQRASAADQRSIASAALAAPIAQAGGAQAAFQRNVGTNARQEGIHQRLTEGKRQTKIKEDLKALRKERGGKVASAYGEALDREKDRQLERWKTNKAFPLEKAGMAQDERQFQQTQAQDQRENQEDNAPDPGGGSDSGGGREGRRNAMDAGRGFIQANGVPKSPREWAGLQVILENKGEISPSEAAYAVKKLKAKARKRQGMEATPHGR